MENFHIRPVVAGDLPGITRVLDETGLFPPDLLEDMVAPYLSESGCRHLWFVGEAAGELVAFGYCEPERMTEGTWNLLAIGVLPSHQGQGVGAAMMDYLERILGGRGERVLLVETMGIEQFAATRRFYRNVGYTEEARIRDYYEPGADKVVFWKALGPAGG